VAALDEGRYGQRQEVLRFDRAEASHEVVARAGAVGAVGTRRDVVERRRSAEPIEQGTWVPEARPTHLLAQVCGETGRLGRCSGGPAHPIPLASEQDVVAGRGVRLQRDIGNETL